MFGQLKAVSVFSIVKKLFILSLGAYCIVTTILLLRLNPKPILIGIDPYGTRIIQEGGDRLMRQEKENFLKHFLSLQYNYDSESFEKRISSSGDLMAEDLWSRKKLDFEKVSKQLKSEELTQTLELKEIREVDPSNFEVDLIVHVKHRLTESAVSLRVDLKIHQNPRRENNPYPYEVESYDENQSS